jgi:hypothetical protein
VTIQHFGQISDIECDMLGKYVVRVAELFDKVQP